MCFSFQISVINNLLKVSWWGFLIVSICIFLGILYVSIVFLLMQNVCDFVILLWLLCNITYGILLCTQIDRTHLNTTNALGCVCFYVSVWSWWVKAEVSNTPKSSFIRQIFTVILWEWLHFHMLWVWVRYALLFCGYAF